MKGLAAVAWLNWTVTLIATSNSKPYCVRVHLESDGVQVIVFIEERLMQGSIVFCRLVGCGRRLDGS